MAVRIGKIELTGLQNLHTEETRTLVEQRVPEQQGSAFQDLGREPVTLLLDGFLHGEDATAALETLRTAQAKAEPLAFAAEIAVGMELTEVIIESFRVRQVAGYRSRYRFALRVREHVEPPEPAGAATAAVARSAQADAAAWGSDNLAAAGVLQDPAGLPEALAANPGMLDALDMGDMAGSLAGSMDALSAGQLDGVVGAIAGRDPARAEALFGGLRQSGSLGAMLAKYAGSGIAFLRNVDPQKLTGLVKAFSGGLEFLQQLAKVAQAGGRLTEDIRRLELPKAIGARLPPPGTAPR